MKKVGIVTHYYSKIKVAAVECKETISVGDEILLLRGGEELFEQTINSIQLDGKDIQSAKKGQTVGIKLKDDVKAGAEIYAYK